MAKKVERIILDTNLWISFLITGDFKKLDSLIRNKKVKLIFSLESIEEFLIVANRPKFKKYFTKTDIELLIDLFDSYGELIDVTSTIELSRDPKDNFLLALAKDGGADYLVTGDQDLLTITSLGKTRIISISEYLKSAIK